MKISRILGISAAGVVAAVALSGLAGADDGAKAGCPAATAHANAMASAVQKFAAVDTDADGALSRAEVDGKLPGIAGAFAELDLDGDGKLTSFEIHHPSGHAGSHGQPMKPAAFQTRTISL